MNINKTISILLALVLITVLAVAEFSHIHLGMLVLGVIGTVLLAAVTSLFKKIAEVEEENK